MDKFVVRTAKRQKTTATEAERAPAVFVSWNCNSLKIRAEKGDLRNVVQYLQDNSVDALFLQETRLLPADEGRCEAAFRTCGLTGWRFYWNSHPTKRYAGTACLVRACCTPVAVVTKYARFIDCQGSYVALPDCDDPDAEGRVMVLDYPQFWVLNVYTPNCSWHARGRQRRTVWDARFRNLCCNLQLTKPVIVAGDLNVCHTDLDVSHPEFFAQTRKPGNVGGRDPGEQGQPGFCAFERDNFTELLDAAQLVDTFRVLHPSARRLTWGWGPSYAVGVYADKFMGLDYVLVPKAFADAGMVESSELGGPSHCHGSDHCWVVAKFHWDRLQR